MINLHDQLKELLELSSTMLAGVSECRQLGRAIEDVASSAVSHYKQDDGQDLHEVLQAIKTIAQLLDVCASALLDVACAEHARIDQLAFQARTCWPQAECIIGQPQVEQVKSS